MAKNMYLKIFKLIIKIENPSYEFETKDIWNFAFICELKFKSEQCINIKNCAIKDKALRNSSKTF